MLIKICGLTRQADAELAESLGADFLGAIMAGGPRNLTPAQAEAVLGPRRHTVRRVVVFGSQRRERVADLADRLDLDVVQLHGDPSPDDIAWLTERITATIWPVIRVEGTSLPARTAEIAETTGAILLDAKVVGQLGGTGVTLDWQALQGSVQALRDAVPYLRVILAGGLKADNVQKARELLAPEVVDVSSGVELAPGLKDARAMEAFIKAGRNSVQNTGHTE
ncbi:MAG: phosphoribosylanthranilate isomerase [Gemmatimonas sp.]